MPVKYTCILAFDFCKEDSKLIIIHKEPGFSRDFDTGIASGFRKFIVPPVESRALRTSRPVVCVNITHIVCKNYTIWDGSYFSGRTTILSLPEFDGTLELNSFTFFWQYCPINYMHHEKICPGCCSAVSSYGRLPVSNEKANR